MINTITTMNSVINDLQSKGFVHTFSIIKDEIGCSGPRKLYKPAEVKIVRQDKCTANPYSSSSTIIYALQTNDGYKGVLVYRCGMYTDKSIEKFIQRASL